MNWIAEVRPQKTRNGSKKTIFQLFRKELKVLLVKISVKQCLEVGMLTTLACLVVFLFLPERWYWVWIAISVLVLALILPKAFQPVAFLWFGLAKVLGLVSTRILLTVTFFLLIVPVGFLRKLLGRDELKLKQFKKSNESVLSIREHCYEPNDLKNTF